MRTLRDHLRLAFSALLLSLLLAGGLLAGQARFDWQAAPPPPETALPAADDPAGMERLAFEAALRGDYAAAAASLLRLDSLQPLPPGMRYRLALYLAASEPPAARPHLQQAAQQAPADPGLQERARLLLAGLARAGQSDEPAYALVQSGRALAGIGEWRLALAAFERAAGVRPDYAEAWAFYAEALQQVNPEAERASQQARELLEKAARLEPGSVAAHSLLALYWQRQQRDDLAAGELLTAIRLDPSNPALYGELGTTLGRLGRLEDGLRRQREAAALAPNDPAPLRHMALYCLQFNYRLGEDGLPAARRALLLNPNDPASLDTLGQVLFGLGDVTTAERFYRRALDAAPDYPAALLHLGLARILAGDLPAGQALLERVLRLDPGGPSAAQAQRLIKLYLSP